MAPRVRPAVVVLLSALLLAHSPYARSAPDPVGQALDATQQANRAAAASQSRIDRLDDQTRQMLERYRSALWQSQQLEVYAQQLEELAGNQEAERESLARQLAELERTERELLPLMLRMVQGLEQVVAEDLPFLQQERKERIEGVKRAMSDPSASNADRFRRILEAYQIEAEYGRTLGAERTQVENRSVDVLRVGRTALFYLTLDGKQGGYWEAVQKRWQPLDERHITQVRRGLRMAREVLAPDLLRLPMPTAAAGASK